MRRFDTSVLVLIAILAAGSTPAAAAPLAYIPCWLGGTSVIDTATDTVTTTIPTPSGLLSVAVAPGDSRVYVSNSVTTSFIDTATNTIVDTAPAGGTTLEVDPTGERLYTNLGVSVVSTATATVVDTIPQTQIYGIAAHPAGSKVYLVKADTDQVVVFNTITNSVVGTIPVGDQPAMAAFNPSGSRLYVSNRGDDTVSVIDTSTDLVIDTIAVGDGPIGVAVTPDGSTLYVVNNGDGTVYAVDTATDTLAGGIYVGGSPYSVSITPDGSKVYVPSTGTNKVSVIDPATYTVLTQITVCGSPIALGKFITESQTTATLTTAVTGFMTLDVTNTFGITGTLDFDAGPFSIFGTPVDIRSALGAVPMDASGQVAFLPGGIQISADVTSSSVPSFSFGGTGIAAFNGDLLVTLPLAAPTGTVLPSGPIYTLVADLEPSSLFAYGGPFTITAILPANTPIGLNVTVPVTTKLNLCPNATNVPLPVDVEFSEVTAAGSTLVSAACQSPASIPPNIRLDVGSLIQLFFDVSTTAAYNPPITICVNYPDHDQDGLVDAAGVDELTLRILHDDSGGNFQPPVNQYVDPVANRVCAEVDHLSPFLLATEQAPAAFVAPDDDARKCENKLLKLTANLVKGLIKCDRKAAEAAFKGRPSDSATCRAGARSKFDDKVAKLGPCPACASGNASSLGDAVESLVQGLNGALYCDGGTPLPDDFGFVPSSDAGADCARSQGKILAKLGKQLDNCYRKLADAGFKGRGFDVAACVADADGKFDAASAAIVGCGTCAVSNTPGLRNQIDRFAVDDLDDVYCAGSTPLSLP